MSKTDQLSKFGQNIPFMARSGLKALKMDLDGIRIMMPLAPNINHIGTMYAGALWTLSESMGGAIYRVHLVREGTFPIVKVLNIKFLKPARTDITCEYKMEPAGAIQIVDTCIKNGKADYEITLELKDAHGNVVATTEGFYQMRQGKGL